MLEQLFLLVMLLFALLLRPLLPFITDWLKSREPQAPPGQEPEAPVMFPQSPQLSPVGVTPPLPHQRPRSLSLPTGGPPIATHRHAPSRLGSLLDVRRGIVLMTILGPCRALEPPNSPPIPEHEKTPVGSSHS